VHDDRVTVAPPPAEWAAQADRGLAERYRQRRARQQADQSEEAREQQHRDHPEQWLASRGITIRGAAQRLFADTTSAEIVLAGQAGTGKSVTALHRIHHAALHWPGANCLILRKTARTLGSTTLATFEKRVIAPEWRKTVTWYGGSPREPASYRYANGSRVTVGGMDAPDKIMSSEYDLIFADEMTELIIDDWEAASSRLRNGVLPWQQLLGCCNPSHPKHWARQRGLEGLLLMLTSRHADNPAYAHEDGTWTEAGRQYIEGRLGNLTGVRRKRLLDGIWAAADGIIYGDWDDALHLVDPFDPPPEWPRWWTVDFGFTNPFTIQWWAEDPDGRLWMYREIYRTGRLVEDHAREILSIVAPGGQWVEPRPQGILCDHDAEGRATLERHLGMSTRPAKKAVSVGIQAVQARLRPAGDGRPRLFVMRGALVEADPELKDSRKPTCLADEIGGYVWAPSADGKPQKEEPLKVGDHAMDCMRYLCLERDPTRGVMRLSVPRGSLRR
jgi:hypothetical protein